MKRHYTTTDIAVLRALRKPHWFSACELQLACPHGRGIYVSTVTRSMQRLAGNGLVKLQWIDSDLQAHRLDWPASLSRILAA